MSEIAELTLETAVKTVADEGVEVIAFDKVPAGKIHYLQGCIYAQQPIVDIINAKVALRKQK